MQLWVLGRAPRGCSASPGRTSSPSRTAGNDCRVVAGGFASSRATSIARAAAAGTALVSLTPLRGRHWCRHSHSLALTLAHTLDYAHKGTHTVATRPVAAPAPSPARCPHPRSTRGRPRARIGCRPLEAEWGALPLAGGPRRGWRGGGGEDEPPAGRRRGGPVSRSQPRGPRGRALCCRARRAVVRKSPRVHSDVHHALQRRVKSQDYRV